MRREMKMRFDRQIPRIFSKASIKEEERFLEDMAKEGWLFYDLTGHIYSFIKGKPSDVEYKIAYLSAGQAGMANGEGGSNLCNEGWVLVSETSKSIFSKEIAQENVTLQEAAL